MYFNEHFKIKEEECLDIPLQSDIELYVDPNRISLVNSPIFDGTMAKKKIESYFLTIFDLYLQGKKSLAIDLLDAPKEINATHLGLSKGNSQGTGPSREILNRFFDKVTVDGRLKKSILSRPVLIPLFVRNFGSDRFSDLIVNIISKELADFTNSICTRHAIETSSSQLCTYYDIQTGKWQTLTADLPVGPDGKPILLVPNELGVNKYGFSAETYVNQIVFVYLQDEHLAKNSSLVTMKSIKGVLTPVKPTKKLLYRVEVKEAYDVFGKVKTFALDQSLENPHLLQQYIEFVEGRTYHLKKN